jgi:hypothetical protein
MGNHVLDVPTSITSKPVRTVTTEPETEIPVPIAHYVRLLQMVWVFANSVIFVRQSMLRPLARLEPFHFLMFITPDAKTVQERSVKNALTGQKTQIMELTAPTA